MGRKSPRKAKAVAGVLKPDDLSLSALLEARESLRKSAEYKQRVKVWQSAATSPAALKRAARTRERRKRQYFEKHRPRGRFRGVQYVASGLLPQYIAVVAAWSDKPVVIDEARERCPLMLDGLRPKSVRDGIAVAIGNGWLRAGRQPREGRYINAIGNGRAPTPKRYRLTGEGRAVKAFAWWIAARRMMGWPLPMTGKRGEWIGLWMRGEDLPFLRSMVSASQDPGRPHGYLPGQGPDMEWPDFGRFAALWQGQGGG